MLWHNLWLIDVFSYFMNTLIKVRGLGNTGSALHVWVWTGTYCCMHNETTPHTNTSTNTHTHTHTHTYTNKGTHACILNAGQRQNAYNGVRDIGFNCLIAFSFCQAMQNIKVPQGEEMKHIIGCFSPWIEPQNVEHKCTSAWAHECVYVYECVCVCACVCVCVCVFVVRVCVHSMCIVRV